NVIPNEESRETDQNSEPSLAVNQLDTKVAEISAFSRPIVTSNPVVAPNPYYGSSNGGRTWTNFETIAHQDTTLDSSTSARFYVAYLFGDSIQVKYDPVPASLFLVTAGDSTFTTASGSPPDQPVIFVNNPTRGGPNTDHIYVGFDDFNAHKPHPVARVLSSLDGGATWNTASPLILDPTVTDS